VTSHKAAGNPDLLRQVHPLLHEGSTKLGIVQLRWITAQVANLQLEFLHLVAQLSHTINHSGTKRTANLKKPTSGPWEPLAGLKEYRGCIEAIRVPRLCRRGDFPICALNVHKPTVL